MVRNRHKPPWIQRSSRKFSATSFDMRHIMQLSTLHKQSHFFGSVLMSLTYRTLRVKLPRSSVGWWPHTAILYLLHSCTQGLHRYFMARTLLLIGDLANKENNSRSWHRSIRMHWSLVVLLCIDTTSRTHHCSRQQLKLMLSLQQAKCETVPLFSSQNNYCQRRR